MRCHSPALRGAFTAIALGACLHAGGVELTNVAAGKRGFVIAGSVAENRLGADVAGAGDVNGDGLDDFIIADGANPNAHVYVVFGRTGRSRMNTEDLSNGDGGFEVQLDAADQMGGGDFSVSVSRAGDVNGDNLADIVIGTPYVAVGANDHAGRAYVVFGKAKTTAVRTSDLELGVGGFAIRGINAEEAAGSTVSGGGDINNDGLDDLVIGAPGTDWGASAAYSGKCFVVFGKATTTTVLLSSISAGVGGFEVRPDPTSLAKGFGQQAASVGDVNGDRFADLVTGNYALYVVFGKSTTSPVLAETIEAGTGQGFLIQVSLGTVLSNVAAAGDVNGDGLGDIVVGRPYLGNPSPECGGALVVFGRTSTAPVDISSASVDGGFAIQAATRQGHAGWSVSGAGDVNKDGLDDVVFTVPNDYSVVTDPLPSLGDRSYVVYGKTDESLVRLTDLDNGVGGYPVHGIYGRNATPLVGDDGYVSNAGDVNGDGWPDLVFGSPHNSPSARRYAGACFVVLGGPSQFNDADSDGISDESESQSGRLFSRWDTGTDPNKDDSDLDGVSDGVELDQGTDPNNPLSKPSEGGPWHLLQLAQIAQGHGGTAANGAANRDIAGVGVAGTGDINHDGIDDVIIGAEGGDPTGRTDAGRSYVVFGRRSTAPISLSQVGGSQAGFRIDGAHTGDGSGYQVAGLGDVNGDGFNDVLISARHAGTPVDGFPHGTVYVVFGKASQQPVDLRQVENGVGGFVVNTESGDPDIGERISRGGDINGDGLADFVIGGIRTNYEVYVVLGKTDTAPLTLANLRAGIGGWVIMGEQIVDAFGYDFAGGGDVNGDGLDDVVVHQGIGYVVFGKTDAQPVSLATLDSSSEGFLILPEGGLGGGRELRAVSIAGDVNGDGYSDLVLGANQYSDQDLLPNAGQAYVVFGKAGTNAIDLATIEDDDQGFVIRGAFGTTGAGTAVSGAGDINHDGFDDVLIGATRCWACGPRNENRNYVVYGKQDSGPVNLASAEAGTGGFAIVGAPDAEASALASTGDFNGDGRDDLLLGAPAALNNRGRALVVFGFAPPIPDADHDLIPDYAETGTGVFVSGTDTGTDPNNPDSDGDGVLDGIENDLGTDPNDALDVPEVPLAAGATLLVSLAIAGFALRRARERATRH